MSFPYILINDLWELGFPACLCKFAENLLCERLIYTVRNSDLSDPLFSHKDTLQHSIFSPFCFNIYLRNVSRHLHLDTKIQYADNIVFFLEISDNFCARNSISSSLESLHQYLWFRNLDFTPQKSKASIFSRHRNDPPPHRGYPSKWLRHP